MRELIQGIIGIPTVNGTVTTYSTDALGNTVSTITTTGYDLEYMTMAVILVLTLYFAYAMLHTVIKINSK